jgi:hypothetical protein
MNHNIIYFFYPDESEEMTFVRTLNYFFHMYPPFLFSKCYLDIARVSSYHFDSPSLMWVPGKYYELANMFEENIGELRIGIKFHVDSYFRTMMWMVVLSLFFISIIVFVEINNNMKGGSLLNPKTWYRIVRETIKNLNLKRMNLKRTQIENMMNKFYDKFLKNEELMAHPGSTEPNTSFVIKEGKIFN